VGVKTMEQTEAPTFEAFFADAEPALRAALVARYGYELGRESAAEAFAWGFEHWQMLSALGNPRGYLYRVGQTAASRLRRQERDRGQPSRADGPGPGDPLLDPDLERALRRLPDRQRAVVVLRFGLDLGLEDTAEMLGISASTVQRHAERGLARLRRSLPKEEI
jgi:DNA-directed RNA polymerase specialized sigma24 family protein